MKSLNAIRIDHCSLLKRTPLSPFLPPSLGCPRRDMQGESKFRGFAGSRELAGFRTDGLH